MTVHVLTIRRPLTWASWLPSVWSRLVSGEHVSVPPSLPHPSAVNFVRQSFAERHGQVADWTFSLEDGSRLHAHELADGGLRIHRDAYDPDRDVASAVLHLATETTAGKVTIAAGVGYGLFQLVAAFAEPSARPRRRRGPAKRAAARRR